MMTTDFVSLNGIVTSRGSFKQPLILHVLNNPL